VLGTIASSATRTSAATGARALTDGYAVAFEVGGGLCVAGAVLALVLLRGPRSAGNGGGRGPPRARTRAEGRRRLALSLMSSIPTRTLGPGGPAAGAIGLGCMGMSWAYNPEQRDDERSIAVNPPRARHRRDAHRHRRHLRARSRTRSSSAGRSKAARRGRPRDEVRPRWCGPCSRWRSGATVARSTCSPRSTRRCSACAPASSTSTSCTPRRSGGARRGDVGRDGRGRRGGQGARDRDVRGDRRGARRRARDPSGRVAAVGVLALGALPCRQRHARLVPRARGRVHPVLTAPAAAFLRARSRARRSPKATCAHPTRGFAPEAMEQNFAIVDRVREGRRAPRGVAGSRSRLAWLLAQYEGVIPIPGTRRAERPRRERGGRPPRA